MATTNIRSPLILDQLINLDDPKLIGIVIAILIVLLTVGKLVYIPIQKVYTNMLTYGRVECNKFAIASAVHLSPELKVKVSTVLQF
jgi:hypothetical protein